MCCVTAVAGISLVQPDDDEGCNVISRIHPGMSAGNVAGAAVTNTLIDVCWLL
jgi:hypothetical protein